MQRNRVWLVLLLLVILAAALVFWLMPREGSPANVAFEAMDASSNRPGLTAVPTGQETPPQAPVPDVEPETQSTPGAPEVLAVPMWKPLPPVPAPRFRKLTMADVGLLDDAEIARRRARVATTRFKVTIRGHVKDPRGEPVAGARVWAHSMSICAPNRYSEDAVFNVFRVHPPSEPTGQTTTDESGAYSLDLQVTGADVEDLLRAVDAEEKTNRGQYQAQAIVRSHTGERRSNGVGVLTLRPDAVIEGVNIAVYEAPMVTFVVRERSGRPVPCAHVQCETLQTKAPDTPGGDGYQVYADEDGLVHLPRVDGWQYTMLTNNGFGATRRIFAPITEERARAPIPIEVVGPLDGRSIVFRALKEGTTEAPGPILYALGPSALQARPTTEGWFAVKYPPDAGRELPMFASGCGATCLSVPDIPAGHCAEYDPLVFPASRQVQLCLVDESGKPVPDARVEGRIVETLAMPPATATIEHLPEDGTTDKNSRVNVRVLPGRPYRMVATLKGGEIAIKRDWVFTGPGPHEWRWQVESGK